MKSFRVDREFIEIHDAEEVLDPVMWGGEIHEGVDVYEKCLRRYSQNQRRMFAVEWYAYEVENGGHHQFFWNSTGIVWRDAIEGLTAIGAADAADILREATRRLGGNPSLDRIERQASLDELKPNFHDLDRRFYELKSTRNLPDLVLAFIRSSPESFYFEGTVPVPESELSRDRKKEREDAMKLIQSLPLD